MTAELGQVFLIGALMVSVLLGTLPLAGAHTGNDRLMRIALPASLV